MLHQIKLRALLALFLLSASVLWRVVPVARHGSEESRDKSGRGVIFATADMRVEGPPLLPPPLTYSAATTMPGGVSHGKSVERSGKTALLVGQVIVLRRKSKGADVGRGAPAPGEQARNFQRLS